MKITIDDDEIPYELITGVDRKQGTWYIELDYTAMYEAPPMSLPFMERLAEFFGTNAIDVDDVSQGGCESCDYGSKYGYTIQVYNPTRNVPEMGI